ncbi:MAG: type I-G CRISPR-associated protein Csb2 [Myxococcales bacterium]|jgi:CRISPR-associated protein Csb2
MPTLLLKFPGRRYHATPWGDHVNEGHVEWPPSPWRLVRALIATGYSKLGWTEVPARGVRLFEKLCSKLPAYRLPGASAGHSRHYMPTGKLAKGRERTTLVFDTWSHVGAGELVVAWDVELTADESSLLAELVAALGYLGRSESWVEARLVGAGEAPPAGTKCFPCDGGEHPGPGWEQVSLLAPETPQAAEVWLAARRSADAEPESRRRAKRVKKASDSALPADLVGCLQLETSWLQEHGWSQPPCSRRALYWRRSDALEAGSPALERREVSASPVAAVLLSISTPSRNDHALPSVVRVLPQGELLHRRLVGTAQRMGLGHLETLAGTDGAGRPLTGHRHAHLLHLDLDGDRHLEHVLLWAPEGLDGRAQAVIRSVRTTFMKGGPGRLSLAVAGLGSLADIERMPAPYGASLQRLTGSATVWKSRTPFVPPRHVKKHGRNSIEGQVLAELEERRVADLVEVEVDVEESKRLRHFVRVRRKGPQPPVDCGFALRLRFARPVAGPLCLGYGSHFGLGVFEAESDASKEAGAC